MKNKKLLFAGLLSLLPPVYVMLVEGALTLDPCSRWVFFTGRSFPVSRIHRIDEEY